MGNEMENKKSCGCINGGNLNHSANIKVVKELLTGWNLSFKFFIMQSIVINYYESSL